MLAYVFITEADNLNLDLIHDGQAYADRRIVHSLHAHLTQTEDVEYKLDGLVLLIEGKSTSADGKVPFSALATIAYDDASHTYRFRAYHDGHYLDTELSVPANGFSWSFTAGPAHIVNTMHLTGKGEWDEVTEVTVGSNPPHRSVDMLLQHLP